MRPCRGGAEQRISALHKVIVAPAEKKAPKILRNKKSSRDFFPDGSL
jgi:hypothetical protein